MATSVKRPLLNYSSAGLLCWQIELGFCERTVTFLNACNKRGVIQKGVVHLITHCISVLHVYL